MASLKVEPIPIGRVAFTASRGDCPVSVTYTLTSPGRAAKAAFASSSDLKFTLAVPRRNPVIFPGVSRVRAVTGTWPFSKFSTHCFS